VSKRHVSHLNNAGSASTTWRYTTYSRQPTPSRWAGWRRAAAQARHESDLRRRYTSHALALYGLPPDWQGERSTGGVGVGWPGQGWRSSLPGRHGRVDRLALVHQSADGASLTVSSHRAGASARFIEATAIDDLFSITGSQLHSEHITGSAPPDMPVRPRLNHPDWQQATISVDAHPVTFRMLTNGNDWVAVALLGDVYLKLHACRFPLADVTLIRVSDPQSYLPPRASSRPEAQNIR
jgi:hypothetical protein